MPVQSCDLGEGLPQSFTYCSVAVKSKVNLMLSVGRRARRGAWSRKDVLELSLPTKKRADVPSDAR
jgi:hypothetical protein